MYEKERQVTHYGGSEHKSGSSENDIIIVYIFFMLERNVGSFLLGKWKEKVTSGNILCKPLLTLKYVKKPIPLSGTVIPLSVYNQESVNVL